MTDRTTLSRDDLYGQVWATPIARLAPQLGLSDVGLAKLCKRHCIPRPPRGYWARLQHGQQVRRIPLPPITDAALATVSFLPRALRAPAPTTAPMPAVPVSDTLTDPSPIVAQTASFLMAAKPDEQGLLRPRSQKALAVVLGPDSIDRAMRVMDALIKTLEERGAKVAVVGDRPAKCVAEIDGELVPFSLREDLDRAVRELTPAEEREKRHYPFSHDRPRYRYWPSGRLALLIDEPGGTGARRRWADGRKARVEQHLPAFIPALFAIASHQKAARLKREEERRRQEEWHRQRSQKLAEIRDEEKRLEQLLAEVNAWHLAERVRAYVADTVRRVEAEHGANPRPGFARWVDWSTQHADRIDPLLETPPSILDEKAKWERAYW